MVEINGKHLCEFCFKEIGVGEGCDCGFSDNPSDALQIGNILNGRYLVGGQIRENRITKEYLCYDSQCDIVVIVKEFFPKLFVRRNGTASIELDRDGILDAYNASMQKFIELMQIPQILTDSGCFIKVLGAFYENATAYFVIENHSLLSVKEYVLSRGKLSDKSAVKTLAKAIRGLSALQKASLYNGNISASNVYIGTDGLRIDGFEPNEDDFASLINEPMVFNRTSYYMSAADFAKRGRDISSDIFSIGAVLYTMLTARFPGSPFDGGSQFDVPALETGTSDASLVRIIKRMCRMDCAGYENVDALEADADKVLQKYGFKEFAASTVTTKKTPNNRLKIIIAVCALIIVTATIVTLAIFKGRNASQAETTESDLQTVITETTGGRL